MKWNVSPQCRHDTHASPDHDTPTTMLDCRQDTLVFVLLVAATHAWHHLNQISLSWSHQDLVPVMSMSLGCLSSANCLWAFLGIILRRGFLLGLHVYPAHYCNKLVLCSDSPIFQWSVEFTRLRNNGVWGSHYVISMHRTVIIQLFRGKYSVPFYGTFKVKIKSKANVYLFCIFLKDKNHENWWWLRRDTIHDFKVLWVYNNTQ